MWLGDRNPTIGTPRFLAAMILSGSARQVKGLALLVLCCSMKRVIAVFRSSTDRNTPCFNARRVSLAKMRRIRKRSGEPFSRRNHGDVVQGPPAPSLHTARCS